MIATRHILVQVHKAKSIADRFIYIEKMEEQSEVTILLKSARLIFNEIKSNYGEFLTSFKYENLSDRGKTKSIREKMDELPGGSEGWEHLMSKQFSFQDEIVSQNGGFSSFVKLLDNLKKLEEINYQLSLKFFLEEKNTAGREQIQSAIGLLDFMEKGLIASMGAQPKQLKKEELKNDVK